MTTGSLTAPSPRRTRFAAYASAFAVAEVVGLDHRARGNEEDAIVVFVDEFQGGTTPANVLVPAARLLPEVSPEV